VDKQWCLITNCEMVPFLCALCGQSQSPAPGRLHTRTTSTYRPKVVAAEYMSAPQQLRQRLQPKHGIATFLRFSLSSLSTFLHHRQPPPSTVHQSRRPYLSCRLRPGVAVFNAAGTSAGHPPSVYAYVLLPEPLQDTRHSLDG
jgi:hypothetical protein